MPDYQALKAALQELADRKWDLPEIEARCKSALAAGFQSKRLNRDALSADRLQILARVQRRAEEYNFFAGNCARSAALSVMEEFGLGHVEVLRALSPFPGFGGTGWMCGGVTGGLAALGLFAGSEDLKNHSAMRNTMMMARQFMARFEKEVGAVTCPKIQEDVVFGRYMDPGASPENMKAFEQAHGFEKCSLLPGIGARIATEIIIDSLAPPA
jgi:C_GCAxxG_C_C family probable redox protein